APLGMTRTAYLGSYNDVVPDRAIGYEPTDSGYRADMPRWLQLGDGAVFTTVEDLVHWGDNFRTTRVGGTAMRDARLTRGRLTNGKEIIYALGLMHGEHRGLATVFHGGSWGGYLAEFVRFPAQGYGVAVLCNRSDADPPALALAVAEVHLAGGMDAVPAPEAGAVSAPDRSTPEAVQLRPLDTYAGSYRAPNSGNVVTIAVEDGALRVLEPGRYDLLPRSADELDVVGAPVRLVFEAGEARGAPARRITEIVGGAPRNVYQRFTPVALTQAAAAAFVGEYRSEELATSLVVTQADTLLHLTLRNGSPRPLRMLGEDELSGAG